MASANTAISTGDAPISGLGPATEGYYAIRQLEAGQKYALRCERDFAGRTGTAFASLSLDRRDGTQRVYRSIAVQRGTYVRYGVSSQRGTLVWSEPSAPGDKVISETSGEGHETGDVLHVAWASWRMRSRCWLSVGGERVEAKPLPLRRAWFGLSTDFDGISVASSVGGTGITATTSRRVKGYLFATLFVPSAVPSTLAVGKITKPSGEQEMFYNPLDTPSVAEAAPGTWTFAVHMASDASGGCWLWTIDAPVK